MTEPTQAELEHNTRRINRRTAFVVLSDLDRERGSAPGLVQMMRELVKAFGVEGALARCKLPPHLPPQAVEVQRWCCEYLAFEEGGPEEEELIAVQIEAQREQSRIERRKRQRALKRYRKQ